MLQCTFLFVTLLTLSNALVKELEQGVLGDFHGEVQKRREQEVADATVRF